MSPPWHMKPGMILPGRSKGPLDYLAANSHPGMRQLLETIGESCVEGKVHYAFGLNSCSNLLTSSSRPGGNLSSPQASQIPATL